MLVFRAALLFCILGTLLTPRGTLAGAAAGASVQRPWRSVSAPTSVIALLDYAMQPPETGGEEGEEDTTHILEPNLPPAGQQQPPAPPIAPPPSFSLPDTGLRGDSIRSFPGGAAAPLETLGPGSGPRTIPAGPSSTPSPVHQRHGILGLPPFALLLGLIVLDIFIVSAVTK